MSGGSQETTIEGFRPATRAVRNTLLPGIQTFADDFGAGQGLYGGSVVADEDDNVTAGRQVMLSQLPGLQEMFGGAAASLEGFIDPNPENFLNTARREALGNNISAIFNQSIRPGIEDRGTFSGQFGGPQQAIALGAATEPLSRAIADAEVNLMTGDANRALQAIGMAPSIFASTLMPGQFQADIGRDITARDQLELEDYIQQFEAERRNRLRGLSDVSGLLTPLTGLSTTQSAPGANPLQGALGGALAGSQIGSAIPGLGTALGAGLGALAGGLGSL